SSNSCASISSASASSQPAKPSAASSRLSSSSISAMTSPPSKNNFVFLRKWFRFTPAFSPISRGSNLNSNQTDYKTADRQGKEEPRHADAPQIAVRIDSYTKRN